MGDPLMTLTVRDAWRELVYTASCSTGGVRQLI
jgi:hypothetical protein